MPVLPEPFYFKADQSIGVILMHIYSGSPNDVRMLGRQLQKLGLSVMGPMFTGHGTDDPRNIVTLGSPQQWWQDFIKAREQLHRDGIQQLLVFGESLGGLFAIQALEQFDDVIAGGTISTPIFPTSHDKVARRFFQDCEAWYRQEQVSDDDIAERMDWLRDYAPQQLAMIGAYTEGVQEDLKAIHQPVFIGQGGADELIDANVSRQLQQALLEQVPVDFHWYEGAPHVVTYSSQAKALATDLVRFVQPLIEGNH